MAKLNKKQEQFVEEYLKCFNNTQAYLRVYPNSEYDSARANAARLIAKDSIKERIALRMEELHMSADEALALLAAHARGDIGKVLDEANHLDMQKARAGDLTKLIKKIRSKETITKDGNVITETDVELYDAQAALDKILRVHGKYKDLSGDLLGKKIIVTIEDE